MRSGAASCWSIRRSCSRRTCRSPRTCSSDASCAAGSTLDDREMNRRADEAMRVFGVEAPVTAPVQQLSIAQRQLAQIARALAVPHRIAIFDEPTASLTPVETAALLNLIRRAQGEGRRRPLHFPPPRRGQSGRRRGDGAARRQAGRDATGGRTRAGRHGAPDGRTRPARALSAAPARADRRAGVRGRRISAPRASPRTRASACGRAKSSASAGLVGAGRTELFEALFGLAQGRRGNPPRTAPRSTGATRAPACAPAPSI